MKPKEEKKFKENEPNECPTKRSDDTLEHPFLDALNNPRCLIYYIPAPAPLGCFPLMLM